MEVLFVGGPLDGQMHEIELPLTETLCCIGPAELVTVEQYNSNARPYFLHTILTDDGIMPMYSTRSDFNDFADQIAGKAAENAQRNPASLPAPADRTLEIHEMGRIDGG